MSMWRLLDIEPTSDQGAIRRAYARRLKQTRPDEDPEGFQALVAARDRALAAAKAGFVEADRDEWPLDAMDRPDREDDDPVDPSGPGVAPTEVLPPIVPDTTAPPPLPIVCDEPPPFPDPRAPALGQPPWPSIVAVEPPPFPDPRPPIVLGPRIIDLDPLDTGQADWEEAAFLARSLPPLSLRDKTAEAALAAWLDRVDLLPLEPRREVEASLLRALASTWRRPDGRLDHALIASTRATVALAAPIFGWPQEDGGARHAFPLHEAALVAQVLRGLLPPDPRDPGVVLVRTGPRSRGPLRGGDAAAFLATSPDALAAYEALRRRAPLPRRLDVFALLAPHVWAMQHRRFGIALATLGVLWIAGLLAIPAIEGGGPLALVCGLASIALFAAVCLATSAGADRILMGAAARAARRADRRALFEPAERTAWLEGKGARLRWYAWVPLYYTGAFVFFAPYVAPLLLAKRAVEALAGLAPGA